MFDKEPYIIEIKRPKKKKRIEAMRGRYTNLIDDLEALERFTERQKEKFKPKEEKKDDKKKMTVDPATVFVLTMFGGFGMGIIYLNILLWSMKNFLLFAKSLQ